MKQRLSSRTEQAIGTWQLVAKELIREPVRDAVREALAEEGVDRRISTGRRSGGASEEDGPNILSPKLLLPLIAIGAAMFYAKQRRSSHEGMTDERTTGIGEQTATGPRAGGSEQASSGEGSDQHESGTEETDEEDEVTARS